MNKAKLKKRLVIGSANFTQKYGADPTKINHVEIKKILDLAKKNSIYKIDTAEGYLNNINLFKNVDQKFQFITKIKPDLLIDLGCNTGSFTKTALNSGTKYAVGFDFDEKATSLAYKMAHYEHLNFLPLLFDASNPTPSQGWLQNERLGFKERAKADAVFGLAFLHHLTIAKNIPLDQSISWILDIAPNGLIEFVPKEDNTVKKMLLIREDIFFNYNVKTFENILATKCKINEKHKITNSGRILYEFTRKN